MPLPNILKNISKHIGKDEKSLTRRGSNSSIASSDHVQSHQSPRARPARSVNSSKTTSLSQINALHAHRNLKSSHQLLLAESMYNSSQQISFDSCLTCNFQLCLLENYILSYFIQFMESYGIESKNLIKCFLQANCLMTSLRQNFPTIDFDVIEVNTTITLEEKQLYVFQYFLADFKQMYYHYFGHTSEDYVKINSSTLEQMSLFFGMAHENSITESVEDKKQSTVSLKPFKLFYLCWSSISKQLELNYYEQFLNSKFFLKYEIEILSSESVRLSDILFSNTAISSTFLDFMNAEGMKTYVDFLIMYKNYKYFSCHYSDARAIYDRFFNSSKSSANTFISFSENILDELKQSIIPEHFVPTCFDKVAFILMQYFSKTYLLQFRQSSAYREYLEDCLMRLNLEKPCIMKQAVVGGTSAKEMSTQHTTDASHTETHSDDLWRRSLKGQLQFTFIDKYGRINSLLEHEPKTSRNDTKLSQVFKKLSFNTSEDKEKEDDAWKVAESIINDVCSVTIDQTNLGTNK